MSRLEFRVAVDSPRPRSALAMVGLASATLAITGQVQPPALAIVLGALVWAYRRGARPAPWQRNRWLLNGCLAGCVAAGMAIDVLGGALIVALAHFGLLAQGLQLVDARPRRTEFLLVALAIFQVTLAANLTDSVFFPPLLIAFTVAAVWTLVVHTLRAEALEAGEPEAARRALSRGLERTTLIASLCSVVLSLALFPLLPRVRSGAIFDQGFGDPVATSGFSERVELGDIGRIRLDPTRVMRVTTLEGPVAAPDERYWRGLAFDRFDGRRWSVTPTLRTPVQGDPEIGVDLGGPRRRGRRAVQQIAREALRTGVLFTPGLPAGFRGAVGRLERDANRALHAPAAAGKRVLYHVVAELSEPPEKELSADEVEAPKGDARYLQLPPLDPRVAALAREITAASTNDADRVRAVERWLRNEGRYTDAPPDFGDRPPVEAFLLERTEGHCEYFASAMVLLLRSAGLPARIVNGFAGGHSNVLGGFLEVAQSDAHTWVEVPYAKAGWVRYDPTPPDLRLASAEALRGSAGWAEIASALELWWFRNVVDFDRGHQARAVRSVWLAWHRWRKGEPPPEPLGEDDTGLSILIPTAPLWGVALLFGVGSAVAAELRRRRGRRRPRLPAAYARALRLLARRGHVRGEAETARGFAGSLVERIPPEAAQAFHKLTDAYLAERFGAAPPGGESAELRALRDSLRASAAKRRAQ